MALNAAWLKVLRMLPSVGFLNQFESVHADHGSSDSAKRCP